MPRAFIRANTLKASAYFREIGHRMTMWLGSSVVRVYVMTEDMVNATSLNEVDKTKFIGSMARTTSLNAFKSWLNQFWREHPSKFSASWEIARGVITQKQNASEEACLDVCIGISGMREVLVLSPGRVICIFLSCDT